MGRWQGEEKRDSQMERRGLRTCRGEWKWNENAAAYCGCADSLNINAQQDGASEKFPLCWEMTLLCGRKKMSSERIIATVLKLIV